MEIVKFKANNGLEVEIEDVEMKGDKKWFDSFIKNSKFVISKTGDNTPAMYIYYNYKGTCGYKFICEKKNFDKNYEGYRLTPSGEYAYVYACKNSSHFQKTMFDFQLTTATEKKVEELITKAVEAFIEWHKS